MIVAVYCFHKYIIPQKGDFRYGFSLFSIQKIDDFSSSVFVRLFKQPLFYLLAVSAEISIYFYVFLTIFQRYFLSQTKKLSFKLLTIRAKKAIIKECEKRKGWIMPFCRAAEFMAPLPRSVRTNGQMT